MKQEYRFMELHGWNIKRVYDELEWYVNELVKATQDPSTPHHHITYLSGKIASKTESIACSIQVVQEQSQRKEDKQ